MKFQVGTTARINNSFPHLSRRGQIVKIIEIRTEKKYGAFRYEKSEWPYVVEVTFSNGNKSFFSVAEHELDELSDPNAILKELL